MVLSDCSAAYNSEISDLAKRCNSFNKNIIELIANGRIYVEINNV